MNSQSDNSASMDQQGVINLSMSGMSSRSTDSPEIPAVQQLSGNTAGAAHSVGGVQRLTAVTQGQVIGHQRPVNLRLAAAPINFSTAGAGKISQASLVNPRGSQVVINASLRPLHGGPSQVAQIPILQPGSLTVLPGIAGKIPLAQVAGRPVKNLNVNNQPKVSTVPSTQASSPTVLPAPLLSSLTPILQQASDAIINSTSNSAVPVVSNCPTFTFTTIASSVKPTQSGAVSILPTRNLKEILPKGSEQHLASEKARADREKLQLLARTLPGLDRGNNGNIAFISQILGGKGQGPDKSEGTATAGNITSLVEKELDTTVQWNGNVGYIPGTNLKCVKNDLGVPGFVGVDPTVVSKLPSVQDTVFQQVHAPPPPLPPTQSQSCVNCGAPRVVFEGKFCSQSCSKSYKQNIEPIVTVPAPVTSAPSRPVVPRAVPHDPNDPIWPPRPKKKKRKISEIIAEKPEQPRIPKIKIKFENETKSLTTTTVSSSPEKPAAVVDKVKAEPMDTQEEIQIAAPEAPPKEPVASKSQAERKEEKSSKSAEATDPFVPQTIRKTLLGKINSFSWQQYLDNENSIGAPSKCFRSYQDLPEAKNQFRRGLKLEAIDPKHPDMYCAVTVQEIKGFRLRLHFDGYAESYDFWVNADSPFIFPCGWAQKNGKKFFPPKGFDRDTFDWSEYLKQYRATAAAKSIFLSTNRSVSVTPISFRVGMKLEALDKKNSQMICVASIIDMLGDLVLVHFDGWENIFDFWCEPSSQYIHPVGFCEQNNLPLSPPRDWPEKIVFSWEKYLDQEKATGVPPRAFKNRAPNSFEVQQKLEAVDRRNTQLIRVATVDAVKEQSIKIHFDGWNPMYDFWIADSSPDIHPVGWCAKTGHELSPPPDMESNVKLEGTCPTPGCTGVGHIKGPKYVNHHSAFGCPYSSVNLNRNPPLADRLHPGRLESEASKKSTKKSESGPSQTSTDSKKPEAENVSKTTAAIQSDLGVPPLKRKKFGVGENLEEANAFMMQHFGKPLYGKGSGRGRKKAFQKILKQVHDIKKKKNKFKRLHVTNSLTVSKPHIKPSVTEQREKPASMSSSKPSISNTNVESTMHNSVFSAPPVTNPYQAFPIGWDGNANILPSDMTTLVSSAVKKWSQQMVADFVTKLLGCSNYTNSFLTQNIDGEALMLMDQKDLQNCLSLKLGPAVKVHSAVQKIKNNTKRLK